MAGEDYEEFEHTLLVVREVNIYKVPPRSTSGGYKCADWLVSSKIWSGRLRVVGVKDVCEIRLEDTSNGELFATCRVNPGQREASVQAAVDSSRYFVLRIDDGRGRHAFIGLGFNERNEAFDFNVALTDHEKHVMNARSTPAEPQVALQAASVPAPSTNFKLQEGQTIKINMKPMGEKKGSGLAGLGSSGGVAALKPLAPPPGGGGFRLAPPPGGGGLKLAPPPSAGATGSQPQGQKPSASNTAAGWQSF